MIFLRRIALLSPALILASALLVGLALAAGTAIPARELAFVTQRRDGATDIHLLDVNRPAFAPLTRSGFPKDGPVWSPDGARLAFGARSWRNGSEGGLYVIDADGRNLRRIVAGGTEQQPAWSPDGRQLAFVGAPDGHTNIFVADVDSGDMRPLIDVEEPVGKPIWSPDGKRIAFIVFGPASGLYIIAVDGGIPARRTPTVVYSPVWSPDGSEIAYMTTGGDSEINVLPANCDDSYVACLDRGRNLTVNPAYDAAPIWSPDGSEIAFYSRRDCGDVSLYLMARAGSPVRRLLPDCTLSIRGSSESRPPAWSPDGREIAVTSQDGNALNIYTVALADGALRRLTNLADFGISVKFPAWKP